MFKSGSLSRWLAGAFIICSFVLGGIAQMTSTQKASNLSNGIRDTGETGSGIMVGTLSGGGGKFEQAMEIASAPSKNAKP